MVTAAGTAGQGRHRASCRSEMEMTADSPRAATGTTTFTASPVMSAAVTPAPGGPTSPSLEQGLGVGMCLFPTWSKWRWSLGWTPWAPHAVLDLDSSSQEWGPLPRSGQGQGRPAEPRQALQA